MKLVLEGGGVRAAYSAGLVHSLAEAGVRTDAVLGCSSGSINAAFYASGQTATVCDLWGDYVPGTRFISWRRQLTPWGGPGLGVDAMLDDIMLGQGLFDPVAATRGKPDLYVAVTDITSGDGRVVRPEAHNVMQWLRASLAIPVGYNRIVQVDGRGYIDGGVAMPVPFDEPIATVCNGPTVVVLTRKMSTAKAAPNWWERGFIHVIVPRAARASTLRQHVLHNGVMDRLRRAVERQEVILVDPPDEMPLSRITRDAGRIRAGIALGREVGRALAARLLALPGALTRAEVVAPSARIEDPGPMNKELSP
jgi:predicted patatin/cPLA2 family phospholipase